MSRLDNLKRVFDQADDIDIREGKRAYFNYRRSCQELAELYQYPFKSVAAVFTALSPNNDYIKNLRSTATVLWGLNQKIPAELIRCSTYTHCKDRAIRFAQGEDFFEVTKKNSLKTRAFYYNILHPWSEKGPVTVDGHIANLWLSGDEAYVRKPLKQVAWSRSSWDYHEIEDAIRYVAQITGIRPNQVQSTLWFIWKRIHNIKYNPNLNLLDSKNHWLSYIPASHVRPYPPLDKVPTIRLSRGRDKEGAFSQWPPLIIPLLREENENYQSPALPGSLAGICQHPDSAGRVNCSTSR